MKIITDEQCAGYARQGHPERPARITTTVERLRHQTELPVEWLVPANISDEQILRAHTPAMLTRLEVPQDFDADTPFLKYFRIRAGFRRRRACGLESRPRRRKSLQPHAPARPSRHA